MIDIISFKNLVEKICICDFCLFCLLLLKLGQLNKIGKFTLCMYMHVHKHAQVCILN